MDYSGSDSGLRFQQALTACELSRNGREAFGSGWRLGGHAAIPAWLPGFICGLWLIHPLATLAEATNDIPPLRPAYPELPPTFWEQHGAWVIVLGGGVLGLLGLILWRWLRPKPPVVVPIEMHARQELEALRHQGEDGKALSQVSRSLRRYVVGAFHLPGEELTTAEFCQAMAGASEIGPTLADDLGTFLHQCDERKFAPVGPASPLGAVERALELIDRGEMRRAELRQTVTGSTSFPKDAT